MNVEHNRMLEAHECKQRKKEPLLFSKIPHTVCVVLLSSSSIGFFSFNLVLRFSFAPSFLPSFFIIIIIVILVSFFYSVCFVFYIVIIERFGYCCFFCDEHTTKEKVFCLKKKIVAILLSKKYVWWVAYNTHTHTKQTSVKKHHTHSLKACNNNIRVLNSIEISYTVNDDNYDDHHISFISLWFTYVFAVAVLFVWVYVVYFFLNEIKWNDLTFFFFIELKFYVRLFFSSTFSTHIEWINEWMSE